MFRRWWLANWDTVLLVGLILSIALAAGGMLAALIATGQAMQP